MKAAVYFVLFYHQLLFAQSEEKKIFPTSVVGFQYAGSIGWISAGYFRQSANEKFALGLAYGYTPEYFGGEIHTLTLKFVYEPFRIKVLPKLQIEPFQTGVFITQNFTNNLYLTWSDKYEKGSYWWTNSMRFHLFFSTEVSYLLNDRVAKKISFYFETNTNDLYFFSYVGNNNWKSLELYDIFFFGIGSKIYFN